MKVVIRQTPTQRRAAYALGRIRAKGELGEKYKSYVSSLGADILTLGLGQAMAGELQAAAGSNSDGKAHLSLYDDIEKWLCSSDPLAPFPHATNLLDAICNAEQANYLRAHSEALAVLEWLKKFARALLVDRNTG